MAYSRARNKRGPPGEVFWDFVADFDRKMTVIFTFFEKYITFQA